MLYKRVTCLVQVSLSCNPDPILCHVLLRTAFQNAALLLAESLSIVRRVWQELCGCLSHVFVTYIKGGEILVHFVPGVHRAAQCPVQSCDF
jgi:hypothetical protein